MRKGVGKTIQARQLGRHLRELRKEAGVSVVVAAGEIGVSDATIYRFESGTSVPRPPDVMVLCSAYGADERIAEALVALSKEADAPGWWRSYDGAIPRWFDTFVSLENAAEHVRAYDDSRVLGLLQTRRYAEAMIRALLPPEVDQEGVSKRVDVRLRRQHIIERRNPPQLDVILGEAVLLRSPGVAVMTEQLSHLDALSRRPNVTLRVLPRDVLHRGLECGSSFTMLDFPTDRRGIGEPPMVYADNLTGAAYLDKPGEVEAYSGVWKSLVRDALSPAESRTVINSYRERYER
ncbi:MAG: helix-turn-helix domain-containing protein [Micromonosporaceae bacterium]